MSHQANLNSLCENKPWVSIMSRPVRNIQADAFNLLRNNLHFPVQRFRWEIYCEYACSTYEYEYEKIIMSTTARAMHEIHSEEKLSLLHFSSSPIFPVSFLLSLPIFLFQTRSFSKSSKRWNFTRAKRKLLHRLIGRNQIAQMSCVWKSRLYATV